MTDAPLDTRVNHIIQPTSKPTNRPKAARAGPMGPPVLSNRLPTSAKHSAMKSDARPTPRNITGPQLPTSRATSAGNRKIAAPTTWFTPMAVRSQRPSVRRSVAAAT
jgi:hypothetical protein